MKLNESSNRLRQGFLVLRKLGEGTYGKVQLALNKETNQEVAIKTIKKAKIESDEDMLRIRREIHIMSAIRHPHIIHIYEVFETKQKIVLVMQYASGGELYDYLGCHKVLPEGEVKRIFRQIVSAVYYCHKNHICHRDLKLENILLDENGNTKIADFGLSNVFDGVRRMNTFCGSPLYASPEIVKGTPYKGPEVDCWSLGVLLYTLIYGTMPFDGRNFKELVSQISEGSYIEPVTKKSNASGLISRLLNPDVSKRATIKDVCMDKWINEGYDQTLLEAIGCMENKYGMWPSTRSETKTSGKEKDGFYGNRKLCDNNIYSKERPLLNFKNEAYNLKPLEFENSSKFDQSLQPTSWKSLLYDPILYYDVKFVIHKLVAAVDKLFDVTTSRNDNENGVSSTCPKTGEENLSRFQCFKNGVIPNIARIEADYVIPTFEVKSYVPKSTKSKTLATPPLELKIHDGKPISVENEYSFRNSLNTGGEIIPEAKLDRKVTLGEFEQSNINLKLAIDENNLSHKENYITSGIQVMTKNLNSPFIHRQPETNKVNGNISHQEKLKHNTVLNSNKNVFDMDATKKKSPQRRRSSACEILSLNFEMLAKTSSKLPTRNRKAPGKIAIPASFNSSNISRLSRTKKIRIFPTVTVAENKEKIEKKLEKIRKTTYSMTLPKRSNTANRIKIQMFLKSHAKTAHQIRDNLDQRTKFYSNSPQVLFFKPRKYNTYTCIVKHRNDERLFVSSLDDEIDKAEKKGENKQYYFNANQSVCIERDRLNAQQAYRFKNFYDEPYAQCVKSNLSPRLFSSTKSETETFFVDSQKEKSSCDLWMKKYLLSSEMEDDLENNPYVKDLNYLYYLPMADLSRSASYSFNMNTLRNQYEQNIIIKDDGRKYCSTSSTDRSSSLIDNEFSDEMRSNETSAHYNETIRGLTCKQQNYNFKENLCNSMLNNFSKNCEHFDANKPKRCSSESFLYNKIYQSINNMCFRDLLNSDSSNQMKVGSFYYQENELKQDKTSENNWVSCEHLPINLLKAWDKRFVFALKQNGMTSLSDSNLISVKACKSRPDIKMRTNFHNSISSSETQCAMKPISTSIEETKHLKDFDAYFHRKAFVNQNKSISEGLLQPMSKWSDIEIGSEHILERKYSLDERKFLDLPHANSEKSINKQTRRNIKYNGKAPIKLKDKRLFKNVSLSGVKQIPKNNYNSFLQMTSLKRIEEANKELREERKKTQSDLEDCDGPLLEALKTYGYKGVISQRFQANEATETDVYTTNFMYPRIPFTIGNVTPDILRLNFAYWEPMSGLSTNIGEYNEMVDGMPSLNGIIRHNKMRFKSQDQHNNFLSKCFLRDDITNTRCNNVNNIYLKSQNEEIEPYLFLPEEKTKCWVNTNFDELDSLYPNSLNTEIFSPELTKEDEIRNEKSKIAFSKNLFDRSQIMPSNITSEDTSEESVSDRIWRKSFYSRFNHSALSRRDKFYFSEGELAKNYSFSGTNESLSKPLRESPKKTHHLLKDSGINKSCNFSEKYASLTDKSLLDNNEIKCIKFLPKKTVQNTQNECKENGVQEADLT